MSDLWLAAGEDAERERYQHHLALARTACTSASTFVLGAATPDEFEHRLALVGDRFDAAVGTVVGDDPSAFLNVRVALLDELNADFGRIHAAREAEAQAERQRVAARKAAEADAARKAAAKAQLNAEFAKLAVAKVAFEEGSYLGRIDAAFQDQGWDVGLFTATKQASESFPKAKDDELDDTCPYCHADWKQPHEEECPKAEKKTSAAFAFTRVAAEGREVPTWTAQAHDRDLVVIAVNQGFTWAVYGEGDEPLTKGRAAKLEQAQELARVAAGL